MVEEKKQLIRKKLTDKDIEELSKILGNVTVTKSGMIRNMDFMVPNPELAEIFRNLGKDVAEIKNQLQLFNKRMEELVTNGVKVIREAE